MAKLKGYITEEVYKEFGDRYKACIRMLNGLEKNSGTETSGAGAAMAGK
jgi:hypothetical protein